MTDDPHFQIPASVRKKLEEVKPPEIPSPEIDTSPGWLMKSLEADQEYQEILQREQEAKDSPPAPPAEREDIWAEPNKRIRAGIERWDRIIAGLPPETERPVGEVGEIYEAASAVDEWPGEDEGQEGEHIRAAMQAIKERPDWLRPPTFGPEAAHARSSDPATSHQAAARVTGNLRETQEHVLTVFRRHGAMTDVELVQRYEESDLPPQSDSGIRTRRRELVDLGEVEDSGEKKSIPPHGPAIIWKLPDPNQDGLF